MIAYPFPTVSGYLRKIIAHLERRAGHANRVSPAAARPREVKNAVDGIDLVDRRQAGQGVLRSRLVSVLFPSEETEIAAAMHRVHHRDVSFPASRANLPDVFRLTREIRPKKWSSIIVFIPS